MLPGTDYVVCAAGAGKRFSDLCRNKPKPLINLAGLSLLERSLHSLEFFPGDRLILVTQKDHGVREALEAKIQAQYAFLEVKWLEITGLTSGQLATAMKAESHLRKGCPLVIFNSDTFFRSPTLQAKMNDTSVDGILPCSRQPGEEWSFCRLNEKGQVAEVAEKKRISNLATVGFYFFRDSELFMRLAHDELKASLLQSEHYVAPLYNRLVSLGKKIEVDLVALFQPMGTPEQIARYWKVSSAKILDENPVGVIVVDLDATLTIEESNVPYAEKKPNRPVIDRLREYQARGYRVIVHTSRRMRTHTSDEASAIADIGEATLAWLRRHGVPFSGLRFGKPYADRGFYVDDKAIRPAEFLELTENEIHELVSGSAPITQPRRKKLQR